MEEFQHLLEIVSQGQEADQITVVANLNPLRKDWVYCRMAVGETLEEIAGGPFEGVISVHGMNIPRESWATYRPQAGSLVCLTVVPQDPVSALITFAITAAAASFTLGLTQALIFAGVITGLSQLAQMLIPPPQLDAGASQPARRLDSLTGVQNRIVPFGVVPKVYGTMKYFPPIPMTAPPYTETAGDEQFLRMLFVVGYGPLYFDGTKVTSEALYTLGKPSTAPTAVWHTATGSPPTLQAEMDSLMDPVAQQALLGDSFTVRSDLVLSTRIAWSENQAPELPDPKPSSLPISGYAIRYEFPFQAPEDGDYTFGLYSNQSADLFINDTLVVSRYNVADYTGSPATGVISLSKGTNFLRLRFVALDTAAFIQEGVALYWQKPSSASLSIMPSEALTGQISASTGLGTAITIGGTPIALLDEVQVEVGDPNQVSLYTDQVFEQQPAIAMPSNIQPGEWVSVEGQQVIRTTELGTDEISIDLEFPGGLFSLNNTAEIGYVMVEFKVEVSPTGLGTWTLLEPSWQIQRTTRDGFRVSKSWLVADGQYDVRLTRVGTNARRKDNASADAIYSAFRSIKRNRRAYVDDNVIVMALRVKASEQFSGSVLDNVAVEVSSYAQVLIQGPDACGSPTLGGSSQLISANPAWAFIDVWTGTANQAPLQESELDMDSILEWGTWCDANGIEFHYVYDADNTVLKVAQEIATTGRAAWLLRDDGKIGVVRDFAQPTPLAVVSPSNSFDFSMSRVVIEPPHALRVQFIDPQTYEDTERIVYGDGFDESTATKFEVLQTRGVKRADQAWKEGRYHLAQIALRPEVYSWSQDIRAITYQKGDHVLLSQDVMGVGLGYGVVLDTTLDGSGNVTTLVTDEPLTMEAGKTYALRIERFDGTLVLQQIQTVVPETTTPTFTSPVAGVEPGNPFLFGEASKVDIEVKVTQITREGDFTFNITAVPAAPEIEDADTGTIPPFDPFITTPIDPQSQAPATPSITSVRSDESVMVRDTDGSFRTQIGVSFRTTASPGSGTSIQTRYRTSDDTTGLWNSVSPVPVDEGSVFLDRVEQGQEYEIQIRAVRANGVASPWAPSTTHTVVGKTSSSSDVQGLTASITAEGIQVSWDASNDPDFAYYVLQLGTVWDAQPDHLQTTATRVVLPITTTGQIDILVKAVDATGSESVTAASTSVVVNAPPAPFGVTTDSGEEHLLVTPSGDLIARLKLRITPVTSPSVTQYEIQWKLTSETSWTGRAIVGNDVPIEYYITPVSSGLSYDLRVRSIDAAGLTSTWFTLLPISIIGKSAPPDTVESFTALAARDRISLAWRAVSNPDISHYEIREGASWDAGVLVAETSSTQYQTTEPRNGPWWIKSVDTSGNFSSEATQASIEVVMPKVTSITGQVVDNTVLVRWTYALGTFALDTFDILKGATLTSAESVGNADTTFAVLLETLAGTYTYWVVPVDMAGNRGAPLSVTLAVAQPPDFVLSSVFQTDWEGLTSTNIGPMRGVPLPAVLTSRNSTALEFNGTSSQVQILDAPEFAFGIGDFTWECSFYAPEDSSPGRTLISKTSDDQLATVASDIGYSLFLTGFGTLRGVIADGTNIIDVSTTERYDIGRLVRVGLRRVGTTLDLLVEGVVVATGSNPSIGNLDNGGKLFLGGTSQVFKGRIAEVRSWNTSLTDLQVQGSLERTLAGNETNLVGYWRMQRGRGNFLADLTGNGNNGTIIDATWYEPEITAVIPFADRSRDDLVLLGYTSRDDMISAGFNYRAQPVPTTASFEEVYDAGALIASTRVQVTLSSTAVIGVPGASVTISTKENLGDAWTDHTPGQSEVLAEQFRYVKVTVDYTSDGTAFLMSQDIRVVLSSKVKSDSGVVTVSANPTAVTFNESFVDIQGITATPQGTTPRYVVVDFTDAPNPTGFDVYLFDLNGAAVTGDVRWSARGI